MSSYLFYSVPSHPISFHAIYFILSPIISSLPLPRSVLRTNPLARHIIHFPAEPGIPGAGSKADITINSILNISLQALRSWQASEPLFYNTPIVSIEQQFMVRCFEESFEGEGLKGIGAELGSWRCGRLVLV